MNWTSMKLGFNWPGEWPEHIDVIKPDGGGRVTYVPLIPWDGERWHCIHCGAELHGYLRRCRCGAKVYGYEDNGACAVLDAAERGWGDER